MATSVDDAIKSVRAQKPTDPLTFGPWKGSMRSRPPDQVQFEYITAVDATNPSNNFLFKPRTGSWIRRNGSSQQFDTFGAAVGMLPAKWSSRVRHAEEFKSDRISDGVPTIASLHTKETIATGLDDGRFSNFWLYDQVNGYNYTLASEYNTSDTYPALGSLQYFKYTPLWYESGDGGITRGITEFTRRFLVSGSRRFLKVGSRFYHPSRYGTPSMWDGNFTPGAIAVAGSVVGARPTTTISGENQANAQWDSSTFGAGGLAGSPNIALDIDEGFPADDGTTFIRNTATPTGGVARCVLGLNTTIPSTTGVYTVTFRAQREAAGTNTTYFFQLYRADGYGEVSATLNGSSLTTSWATYTTTITIGASPSISPPALTTVTNGTTTLTSVALFSSATITPGMAITGTDIPPGTTITSVTNTSTLIMSAAATDSTSNTRTFTHANRLGISATSGTNRVSISALTISDAASVSAVGVTSTRLIPSGPIPPTHCGSIATGAAVTAIYMRPDADKADGSWLNSAGNNTNMFSYVDEATADDTDYITSNASNTTCDLDFGTPSAVPTSADTVTLRYRHRNIVASGVNSFTISVMTGTTVHVSAWWVFNSTSAIQTSSLSLNAAVISAINGVGTGDWSTVFVRMTTTSESLIDQERIYQLYFEILPAAIDSSGGFKGKDRFFRGFYYRFEDDSIWALTVPRFPNSTLTAGLDLVTVDSTNPETAYTSITHQNIPVGPKGVKSIGICRTDKIDSTVDDDLLLNPTGFKLIAEVPNGTTSYVDYSGDDASLVLDVEQYFIRYDHIMPPRSRYIYGGDMRVCHSYGGNNPCAIVIAPVGRAADWDLNLPDTSSTLYTSQGSWMQIGIDSSGVGTLTLIQGDGATAANTKTFTLVAATATPVTNEAATMQQLVDLINATSFASDGQQWRAQICPGASPDANPLTALTPHNRAIASCVIDNTAKTITKAAGGLSKVAVGQLISGAAEETGAYVTVITSDTSLTYTGTLATGTETLYFYNTLGDAQITDPDTSALGFQRVISNSAPGFLYFNKTYLDTQTFDKSATWMTVATPGSVKSAPNCFSGKSSNRFTPPLESGICQGGGAVDHGFVVLYGNKVGAIRPRGPDSFLDTDYGLTIIDESRGCCAWNTICAGNRFIPFLSSEGMFAANLEEVKLLSEDIYVDQPAGLGDFRYEGPQSVAATATDNDLSYAWARVARGSLFVGYRSSSSATDPTLSASTTHCNAISRLDFSSGDEATGLPALFRKPGETWGWSTPQIGSGSGASSLYRFNLIAEGRRSDGLHIYGWNDEHGGSTGDGRIDELDTGSTDNGTAITGRVETPWIRPPDGYFLAGQEAVLEHNSPIGSTGSLVYHRTFSDDSYTLTPGTSTLGVYSELKMLPFNSARANANAAFWDYRQATGSSREIRRLVFKFKRIRRLKVS